MTCKYKIFFTSLFMAIFLLPVVAGAGDACKEGKELKKQRYLFDAEMRIKRSDIYEKIIDIRKQMISMDREMAALEREGAYLEGPRRKEIMAKYEAIADKRDVISDGLSPIQDEYSNVTMERTKVRLDFKKQELKKRYECVLNEELNKKIGDVLETAGKKFDEKGRAEVAVLAKERAAKIELLKKEYAALEAALEEKWNFYLRLSDTLKLALQREEEYDKLVDKQIDEVYNQLDKAFETLDKYGDEIAAISEKLIPYTDGK